MIDVQKASRVVFAIVTDTFSLAKSMGIEHMRCREIAYAAAVAYIYQHVTGEAYHNVRVALRKDATNMLDKLTGEDNE